MLLARFDEIEVAMRKIGFEQVELNEKGLISGSLSKSTRD